MRACVIFFVMLLPLHIFFFFFFNDTATTEIYTLSLHDALPILLAERQYGRCFVVLHIEEGVEFRDLQQVVRSEEHTSELQSQSNLVCRLLLEKKKKNIDLKGCVKLTAHSVGDYVRVVSLVHMLH